MLLLTQPSFSTWTSLPLKAKHYRNHQSRKFVEEETEASKGERNKNKSYLKHQYSIYYILLFFKPVSYYLFTNISLLCYDCFTGWRGRMSYTRCCCHCRKQSLAARSSTRWHCLNCCSRSDIQITSERLIVLDWLYQDLIYDVVIIFVANVDALIC